VVAGEESLRHREGLVARIGRSDGAGKVFGRMAPLADTKNSQPPQPEFSKRSDENVRLYTRIYKYFLRICFNIF
jgi:hypothetical protein